MNTVQVASLIIASSSSVLSRVPVHAVRVWVWMALLNRINSGNNSALSAWQTNNKNNKQHKADDKRQEEEE